MRGIMQTKFLTWGVLALTLLVGACAQNPIPEGYSGPVANLADSGGMQSGTSANLFFAEKIDDRLIQDSLSATKAANYGGGFALRPAIINRNIPARPCKVTITGRTHYAAPILELINKVYQVSGIVDFDPQPNGNYVVTGVLGDDYSAVWIEDVHTGNTASSKIEVKGSSTLGILEK
jgi:hypothetical protein